MRDLGEIDLWEESLQRSLARRGRLPRSSPELAKLRPDRDLSDEAVMSQHTSYWRMRREARNRRPLMPVVGLGGVSTVAVLVATLPGLVGGRSASARAARLASLDQRSGAAGTTAPETVPSLRPEARRLPPRLVAPRALKEHRTTVATATPVTTTHAARAATTPRASNPATIRPSSGGAPTDAATPKPAAAIRAAVETAVKPAATVGVAPDTAQPASHTTSPGYTNPLAHASVTPERIDQGVDYGGTGTLTAIGAGQITYVATSGTGWPGAFIEFRLSNGPDAGRYVFYAEGIVPAQGLHVGERISAGQTVATMTGGSGGIEIGWGAGVGTETYAMKDGEWKPGMDAGNVPTASGKSFSALVASLGGPAGKIEG